MGLISSTNWLSKVKPATGKKWLLLIAGLMWSAVGILLCRLAYIWLQSVNIKLAIFLASCGFLLSIAVYWVGFRRFAGGNIDRIKRYSQERICLFAFQRWTSYPLVLVMISLGIFFREYSQIPKYLLAVMYIGIGGGLLLASTQYYIYLVRLTKRD